MFIFNALLSAGHSKVSSSSGREVVTVVHVLDQSGLRRFPAKGLTRDGVGRREVQRNQIREEPKISRQHQYVRGNAHSGHTQTAANGLGYFAEFDTLVLNTVPVFASRALLQRQAKQ